MAADLACAIADDGEVISDQAELFGPTASVPIVWRTLNEIAAGGQVTLDHIAAAVNAARRTAWAGIVSRHRGLPGVRIADRMLDGVTCIRIDATVTAARSDRQWAEPELQGLRPPSAAVVLRQHRRAARAGDAPRLGRVEHRGRSHRDRRHLDRRAAAGVPAQADGHDRRRRGQPQSWSSIWTRWPAAPDTS